MRRSYRYDDGSWRLWVDSRHRITFPKALLAELGWLAGDTLSFSVRADGALEVRSLDRDLRVLVAELESLRGSSPGSVEADRVVSLGHQISSLADRLYPVDETDRTSALAEMAFGETQTRAKFIKMGAIDAVDAVLASLETRRIIHRGIQNLRKGGR